MDDLIVKLKHDVHAYLDLRWFCAVSGGPDSLALLYWLTSAFPQKEITVVHINHHWQESSCQWEHLVAFHAKKLSCPLQVFHQVDSIATEENAREKRLEVFSEILDEQSLVFLGHHLDDQIETSLWRWLRGNWYDLSAMSFCSKIGHVVMLRPFLETPQKELRQFISNMGVVAIEDPANDDLSLTRNFLRHKIIPVLKDADLFSEKAFLTAAQEYRAQQRIVEQLLPELKKKKEVHLPNHLRLGEDFLVLLLRQWIKSFGQRQCSSESLRVFSRQCLEAKNDKMPLLKLPEDVQIYYYKKTLYWTTADQRHSCVEPKATVISEKTVRWAGKDFTIHSADVPVKSFEFSKARKNDKVTSLSFPNGIKVSELWSSLKIPPFARWRYPLVRRDGEFVQLGHLCINEKFESSGEYFIDG